MEIKEPEETMQGKRNEYLARFYEIQKAIDEATKKNEPTETLETLKKELSDWLDTN